MTYKAVWSPAVASLMLTSLLTGCGGGSTEAPGPGSSNTLAPDLRGRVVMVLPVQSEAGVAGDADAELAFALESRGQGIDWVFRSRLESSIQRSPGLNARTTGLPVGMFLRREVERVGDPLYGELRRLAALVNAEVALIPIQVAPGERVEESGWPLQVAVAIMDVVSGRVLWYGVVEGDAGEAGSPGVLASTMDGLARRLLWYMGG